MERAATVTLYANPLSPYVNKVRAFLNLKQLDYDVIYVEPGKQRENLAFSGQGKVPVVTAGDEVLFDSTPICLRLDELYPENTVIPEASELRARILEIDRWVSERLIPTGFFTSQNLSLAAKLKNGWLSGRIHSVTAPDGLPLWMRLMWPIFVVRAKFVSEIIDHIDPAAPVPQVRCGVAEEFVRRLEGGPFLGGQPVPSLPDCAAYGHFIPCWMAGMDGYGEFIEYPRIRDWVRRMTPLVYAPRPFWPDALVGRDPRLI